MKWLRTHAWHCAVKNQVYRCIGPGALAQYRCTGHHSRASISVHRDFLMVLGLLKKTKKEKKELVQNSNVAVSYSKHSNGSYKWLH